MSAAMNPHVTIIPVSAKTGEGLSALFEWVQSQVTAKPALTVG